MPTLVKIWDADANDGKGQYIELYSLNAAEAVKNDVALCKADKDRKRRYFHTDPNLPKVDVTEPRAEGSKMQVPANWEAIEWPERRKIALTLGAGKKCTSEIANAIIEAAINRGDVEVVSPAEPAQENAA